MPELVAHVGARWTRRDVLGAAIVLGLGTAVRLLLLPTRGFAPDLDVFAKWTHDIAVGGLSNAYRGDINLGPVMVYLWSFIGAIDGHFSSIVDSSNVGARVLLKSPAVVADLLMAMGVAWSLRRNPGWAIVGGLAMALHPALVDVSAWWGQYDSVYVLPALAAYILAAADRPYLSAAALAVSLATKPQALPLLVPFAAYALRRLTIRQLVGAIAVLVGTTCALWGPFILADGLAQYVRNLAGMRSGAFASVSIGAWNLWWLVPTPAGADTVPLLGPLTPRDIGYGLTALGELAVFAAVWETASPRRLALGLASAALVAFCFLTSMHERYSLGALVFLAPLLPDRKVLAVWLALSLATTADLLLMVQPWSPATVPLSLILKISVIGSGIFLSSTAVSLWLLARDNGPSATYCSWSVPPPT